LAQQSLASGVDPKSPDYMNFHVGEQAVVDSAMLAQALLRAPRVLWEGLDATARKQLIVALRLTRQHTPYFNNHLLFAAIIETVLLKFDGDWDPMRVDYALRQFEQWYIGDGTYTDGPLYRQDYYSAGAIHPLLIDILVNLDANTDRWRWMLEPELRRARRHAQTIERMISPEGTIPVIGRSLAGRGMPVAMLGQLALRHQLPPEIPPAQARAAMTAVLHRLMDAPGTFDENGWLTIGFCGHQPEIGEGYISTGSLYCASFPLVALGLNPDDAFWSDPPRDWTSRKIYAGIDWHADHAVD
jgi:hypothetical protein